MQQIIFIIFTATIFLTPLIIAPFTIDYYHPPKELFSGLAISFCLMLWLLEGIREARFQLARTKFYFGLLLFCAVSGLSLIWARSRYLGLRDYSQLLTFIVAFFIAVNTVDRHRKAVVVARAAVAAGLLSAAYAVFQYFGLDFIRYPEAAFPDWRFRLYSTFGNPDFLANYLVLIFPLGIVFYLLAGGIFKKLIWALALVVIYSALLVTFSVGALLGVFFSASIIGLFLLVKRVRLKNLSCREESAPHMGAGLLALLLALGAATLFFFSDTRFNQVSVLRQARASFVWRHGLANRLLSYRAAYRMIRDRPVLGVGFGNFKLRFPEYRGRWLAAQHRYFDSLILDKERDKHVHNELLQVWAETGVFGFVIFILILLTMFKNGVFLYYEVLDYKKRLFLLGLLWALASYIIHALFSFPMHIAPCGLLFWTLAGLLFARLARRDAPAVRLNINAFGKGALRLGVIISGLILYTWLGRMYLSDVFLKRMVEFDKKGGIEEALVEARTSLFFNPDSNAVIYVGNYAAASGDYGTASRCFRRALGNNDEINFHIALAESYYKEGLPHAAISEYVRVLLLNPFSLATRLRLAELYVESQMYDKAQLECQFVLMNNAGDENINKRITGILNKIFDRRILSDTLWRTSSY